MNRESRNIVSKIDWVSVVLYFALVLMGWISIYAAVFNVEHQSILDTSQKYGKQLIWIGTSIIIILGILFLDGRMIEALSVPTYVVTTILLVLVLVLGKEISGARSWFALGGFSLQPSEFAKFGTALIVAKHLSIKPARRKANIHRMLTWVLFMIPAGLIALQPDMGSVLVFSAFIFVLYREGLPGYFIFIGLWLVFLFIMSLLFEEMHIGIVIGVLSVFIAWFFRKNKPIPLISIVGGLMSTGFVYAVNFIFNNILAAHQQSRFKILLGIENDFSAAGYNTRQSLIAIGSGGLSGKGFLQGTQTKFDFVPEQSTDYIFCTVGEEWGFLGSALVVILFLGLCFRIIWLAEKQKTSFARIYGYSVASILFVHFTVNIGMAIGLLPVIGIPLPFFSYGGSSLWGFTILLFIFLKLDAYKWEIW